MPQLSAIRQRGHEVTVILPAGGGRLREKLQEHAFDLVEIDWDFSFRPGVSLLRGLFLIRRAIRQVSADTVFYHLYASALATRLATLFMPLRRVHMVAGPLYLDSPYIRQFERVANLADHMLIAGSHHTMERYREFRRRDMVAIPYGVDCERFSPTPGHESEGVTTSADVFTVIMVAYVYAPKKAVYRGVGIKGHEILIEAWRRFSSESSNAVRLVMVGSGFSPAGATYRTELIEGSADMTSIEWYESVHDVRSHYDAADLSVAPSLTENHGSALESSAMGLPAIVSDAGALPEAVEDGVTGWIVPAGQVEPLVAALHAAHAAFRAGRLDAMGATGRRLMIERFELQDCSERVADAVLGSSR